MDLTFSEDSEIRMIQKVELDLLKQVSTICQDNSIKFFLRGGSVMGAVKYRGFVPWDDDTDIAVPRYSYRKFIEVFSRDWSEKYWLASYQKKDAIHAYFPRFLLREKYRKTLGLAKNNHLGFTLLDVLPLDGVPSQPLERRLFEYHVMWYRLLGAVHTAGIKDTISQHKGARKIIIDALHRLHFDMIYSQRWTYDKLDKIYSRNSLERSHWSGTITGSSFDKEIFPKQVWGDGVILPFEDTEFRVPTKYDEYLKQIYGQNYANEEPVQKKTHQMTR